MEKRIKHNLEIHISFIDLEKAYDRVNGKKMFEFLKDKGINRNKRRVLKNIYKETKVRVRIGNKLSQHATIKRGICQGCPLSCMLFNTRMDHMIIERQKTDLKGIRMHKQQGVNTVLFADDQAVLAETENHQQRAIF